MTTLNVTHCFKPVLVDARGSIRKILREDDPSFDRFGEVYITTVRPNVIKAWHRHKKITMNLYPLVGTVFVVFGTETADMKAMALSPEAPALLTIPPGLWVGWKAISPDGAQVLNVATHPHEVDEMERQSVETFPLSLWEPQHG